MNVLSKQYKGVFYVVAFVLSTLSTILVSDTVVDLGWPWVGPAASAVSTLLLLVQQFTKVGDAVE